MPGANYMGGKRNLARSRAKDAVGRAQRRHFGLQRLQNIFTQGLTTSATDSVPRGDHGIPEISLAHARRESAESAHSNENEDQYHDRRESSPDRQSAGSKSSERSRSSRVLRALNVEEPLLMQAAVQSILETSDLAGIGRHLRKQQRGKIASPEGSFPRDDYIPDASPNGVRSVSPSMHPSSAPSIIIPVPRIPLYPSFAAMNASSDPHQLPSPPASELFLGDPRLLDPDGNADVDSLLARHATSSVLDTDFADSGFDFVVDTLSDDERSRPHVYDHSEYFPITPPPRYQICDHERPDHERIPVFSRLHSPSTAFPSPHPTISSAHRYSTTNDFLLDELPLVDIGGDIRSHNLSLIPENSYPYRPASPIPDIADLGDASPTPSGPNAHLTTRISSDSGYATHAEQLDDGESDPLVDPSAAIDRTLGFPSPELPPIDLCWRTDNRRGVGFAGPACPSPLGWDWGSSHILLTGSLGFTSTLLDEVYEDYGEVIGMLEASKKMALFQPVKDERALRGGPTVHVGHGSHVCSDDVESDLEDELATEQDLIELWSQENTVPMTAIRLPRTSVRRGLTQSARATSIPLVQNLDIHECMELDDRADIASNSPRLCAPTRDTVHVTSESTTNHDGGPAFVPQTPQKQAIRIMKSVSLFDDEDV